MSMIADPKVIFMLQTVLKIAFFSLFKLVNIIALRKSTL